MRREPFREPAAVIDLPALRVTVGGQRAAGPPVVLASARAWTLGRASDSDVVVDDARVSRRHLQLEPAGGGWRVRDVSSHGSWLAGGRVPAGGMTLPPGVSVVRLGAPDGPEVVLTAAARTAPPAFAPAAAPGPPPGGAPSRTAGASRPPRRRRRGRGLLIAFGVLVVLLLVGDRVAAAVAGTAAVSQIVRQSQGVVGEPEVSFGGFPFLTQVATGTYSDVHVELADVTAPDAPRLDRIDAHLRGAHLPLSAIVGGDVSSVPIDRVDATVEIGLDDLNAYLADQEGGIVVSAGAGDTLQLTGGTNVAGSDLRFSGRARLGVEDGTLVVTPVDLQVTGGGSDAFGDLAGGLASLLPPVPVPLGALPFDLRLTSVEVGDGRVTASARASGLTLQVPQ